MFGGGIGPMGGGGGMLRAASRAMTRMGVAICGIQDPFASSTSSSPAVSHQKPGSSGGTNNLTISSDSLNLPVAATAGWSGGASSFVNSGGYEEFEWVSEEGSEEEDYSVFGSIPVAATAGWSGGDFSFVNSSGYEEFEWVSEEGSEEEDYSVFGSVPSLDEVQDAVSTLQQVFDGSSFGSDMDWMEPSMQLCHSRILQPHGYDQVYGAFDLLRTEPSVQRMVISLSSDKAVWEAVMNNEVVREIRDLYNNGISEGEKSSDDDTPGENNAAVDFIKWVFDNTMVKATEVFEKITKVVTECFNRHNGYGGNNKKGKDAKFNNWLEEKLRTSVLLSIVVLLVVMVSRAVPAQDYYGP